jgi:peptidoglycan hydrolase-like protein with peptidoglycan-binding domain
MSKMLRRFAAMKRIPRRALILSCVAVAVIITFVFLFAHGNASGNTARQAAAYEASETPAPQTSSSPDAASAAVEPSALPAPSQASPEPSETGPLGGTVFMEGMSDPLVALIQQRLMELKYMDDATPTDLYGPLTKRAVIGFQRQAGLPMDGCMGPETYAMLMSPDAPVFAVGLGAQGPDVEDMIYRLYKLDYIDTAPDVFTKAVKTAVRKFQETNGLDVDGIIGAQTRKMLFSDNAKEYGSGGGAANVTGGVTTKTNLKPDSLESVLPSALNGLGQALYDGEQQYGINSLFVLAIINYESGYGTSNLAQTQNNLGGLKAGGSYKTFSSKAECVDYMYNLLSRNYIGNGLVTIEAIGEVYCGGTWAAVVTGYMQDLIAQF